MADKSPNMREKREGKAFLRIEVDKSLVNDINQVWDTKDHAALQARDDEWQEKMIKPLVDGLELGKCTHPEAGTYKAIAEAAEKAYVAGGVSANTIFSRRLKSALR